MCSLPDWSRGKQCCAVAVAGGLSHGNPIECFNSVFVYCSLSLNVNGRATLWQCVLHCVVFRSRPLAAITIKASRYGC